MSPKQAYFIDWFPNKPVRLEPDKTYRIGRGGGNEFFLPDVHSSREHAEIKWNGEAFVLKDLGSSNGTFVNGEAVAEHVLEHGDEIEIGTHVLRLRVEDAAKVAEDYEKLSKEVREWKTVVGYRPDEGGGLSGTIEHVDLGQVVQMLEVGRHTGRLLVTSKGSQGSLYFTDGRVVAASFELTAGTERYADHEAVYRILGLQEGVFEFLAEEVEIEPRIQESTQALLMETFRRLDEKKRGDKRPGKDTVVL
jgi:hypothetical protein